MHPPPGSPSGSPPETPPRSRESPSAQPHPATPGQQPESHSLLAAIVESSDDAIISKNTEGIITSWNRAAERIFGYSAQEAIGRHITLIAMPDREGEMIRILGRVLSGEQVDHHETVRRHKDGHPVLVSLTVSPIRNNDGVIIGASKIARDITARKKTEQVLQQTEKLAMLGRLSATIAHEINNPLESVTNLLYLLRNYSLPAEADDYLQMAEMELARISNIVTQTLAFHKQNSQPRPADLAGLTDSALAFLSHRTQNHPIQLERRYHAAPPVLCYDGEIWQVILNLLSNALDALRQREADSLRVSHADNLTIPAARLVLACRPATDWHTARAGVRFTIADNGCGIPPEALPRIFEAFFTTKGVSGNGLGLWISSEIIQRHHGRIRVRSSRHPGRKGTVFAIFLPHQDNQSQSIPSLDSFQQSL